MPEIYDRCLGPALFAPFAADLAQRARRLAPSRILEIAAGTGIATAALHTAVPEAAITATDLNPAMVARGAEQVPGATWMAAAAQNLPFPDASFDLVVCQFGAMFFPDRPAAYAEAARVMAPGATMIFSVWDRVEGSLFPTALMDALAAVVPDDPPDFVVRIPHGYSDPARIEEDFRTGGLPAVTVDRVVLEGCAAGGSVIAEGFCLGTPLRFALQERGSLDALTAAVATEMDRRLGRGPVTGALAAFVITAQKLDPAR